jgi:hypothetical protein
MIFLTVVLNSAFLLPGCPKADALFKIGSPHVAPVYSRQASIRTQSRERASFAPHRPRISGRERKRRGCIPHMTL